MKRLALLVGLLLIPLSAQGALYMTDEAAGDDRLLVPEAPTGDSASLLFSPLAAAPDNTYDWTTTPIKDDLLLDGTAVVELTFDVGADVASRTTVTLLAVADGTERELGSAEDATPADAPAHTERFELDVAGQTIQEGETIVLRISVTEVAALVQMRYGGSDAPSGITTWPAAILDTDGDGVGDSAERRAGTDPNNAQETPGTEGSGSGGSGSEGTGSEGSGSEGTGSDPGPGTGSDSGSNGDPNGSDTSTGPEVLLATFFLLLCLCLAGYALLWRPTP